MGAKISLQTATLGAVRLSALPIVYAAEKQSSKSEEKGDVIVIPVDQSKHAEAAFECNILNVALD